MGPIGIHLVLALIVIVAWFAREQHALEPWSGRERLRAERSLGLPVQGWSDLGLSLAQHMGYGRRLRSDVLRERARRLLADSAAPTRECIPILEAARAALIGPRGAVDEGPAAGIMFELARCYLDLGHHDLATREVHASMRYIGTCGCELLAIELSARAHLLAGEVAAARGDRETAEKAWRVGMREFNGYDEIAIIAMKARAHLHGLLLDTGRDREAEGQFFALKREVRLLERKNRPTGRAILEAARQHGSRVAPRDRGEPIG